jgi:hypothetical protein
MKALLENPFFVLDVPWDAPRATIEREAQKLLGMLELGFAAAQTYNTPLGPQPRTNELVRTAVAALRDPGTRVQAEFWAAHAGPMQAAAAIPSASTTPTHEAVPTPRRPAQAALLQQLGWAARGHK